MAKPKSYVFLALVSVVLISCVPNIPEIAGTAYYIDCTKGDDNNMGTSPSYPWGSLGNVNTSIFQPGDGVFFKRGTICQGALAPQGSGKEGRPIIMGSYGRGELPIIDAGDNPEAIRLVGQEYWEIQDLETIGGTRFGVLVSGEAETKMLRHIRLKDLLIHDVWGEPFEDKTPGLVVVLSNGSIFKDVVIDGVTAYNSNQWAGIEVNGSTSWPIDWDNPEFAEDVVVRNSTVYNVYGDGIVLWGVRNGLIEYSVAHDTGQQPAPKTVGTPSSIWTWSCYDCVVQYNESYNAASPDVDAGCFDMDWGTRNNIFQYNYGHDCDGYCLSVFGAGGTTTVNATVRYNVCANNGRRRSLAGRQGDIFLSAWSGGDLDGVRIHNNTFFWTPESNYPPLVNRAQFTGERLNIFANNIIVSTVPWIIDGGQDLELDHNLYWLEGEGEPFFSFDDEYYKGFDVYQNQGNRDSNSLFADPRLINPNYHETGIPEDAFTLEADSPAIDAGLDLGSMGESDFYGNPVPFGDAFDIGAHEWTSGRNTDSLSLELAAISKDLYPAGSESKAVLVGLIDPQDEESRSQAVFLRSMAYQYADQGLHVMLLDVSGLSDSRLRNLVENWHLGGIPLSSYRTEISSPMTMIFGSGELLKRWDGLTLPAEIAFAVQEIVR